jgi:hypothetical protein
MALPQRWENASPHHKIWFIFYWGLTFAKQFWNCHNLTIPLRLPLCWSLACIYIGNIFLSGRWGIFCWIELFDLSDEVSYPNPQKRRPYQGSFGEKSVIFSTWLYDNNRAEKQSTVGSTLFCCSWALDLRSHWVTHLITSLDSGFLIR